MRGPLEKFPQIPLSPAGARPLSRRRGETCFFPAMRLSPYTHGLSEPDRHRSRGAVRKALCSRDANNGGRRAVVPRIRHERAGADRRFSATHQRRHSRVSRLCRRTRTTAREHPGCLNDCRSCCSTRTLRPASSRRWHRSIRDQSLSVIWAWHRLPTVRSGNTPPRAWLGDCDEGRRFPSPERAPWRTTKGDLGPTRQLLDRRHHPIAQRQAEPHRSLRRGWRDLVPCPCMRHAQTGPQKHAGD